MQVCIAHRALPVKLTGKVSPEAGRIPDGPLVQPLKVLPAVDACACMVLDSHRLRPVRCLRLKSFLVTCNNRKPPAVEDRD